MGKDNGHKDFVFLESWSGEVVHVALVDVTSPAALQNAPRRTLCCRTLRNFNAFIHFHRRDTTKYFCSKCYTLLRKAVNSVDLKPTRRLL